MFGCAFYLINISYNQNKLQFMSVEWVFLGVSLQHKRYKWLTKEEGIFIYKNVSFNKCKFPYSIIFPPLISDLVIAPVTLSLLITNANVDPLSHIPSSRSCNAPNVSGSNIGNPTLNLDYAQAYVILLLFDDIEYVTQHSSPFMHNITQHVLCNTLNLKTYIKSITLQFKVSPTKTLRKYIK